MAFSSFSKHGTLFSGSISRSEEARDTIYVWMTNLRVPSSFFQEKMLPLPNDFSKLDNLLFNKPEPKQKMVEVKLLDNSNPLTTAVGKRSLTRHQITH